MDKIKIEQYVKGLSSKEEIAEIEALFIKGEADPVLYNTLEDDFNNFLEESPVSDIRLDHILGNLHSRIKEKELEKKVKTTYRIFSIYSKIAAILLLPLIIAGAILLSLKKDVITSTPEVVTSTIFAPLGSRVSFTLPDGSTGMLNSGSSLTYSVPFINNRKLALSGEAWFEVKHDVEHPFEIEALNASIKVLGTSFNLSAYKDDNYVELVLNKGKVEFYNKANNERIMMKPSERLVFRDGVINKTIIDTSKFNGWTEGKLIFRGDPMNEVARRIMRWYNVDIVLADKELENYSFRAIFADDKLEEVLTYLAMTSPISYKIIPRSVNSDGTFVKEKVIISLLEGGK